MIKRFIACLTICLIITGFISPVFSHAEPIPIYTPNWDNPGIAEIINISDLTGWMANGGVYDITSFQNLDEFLTWYFKIRVPVKDEDGNITFAPTYGYDTYFDSNYTSPRFIEQSNIRGMISRSYQNKTGYGRRLQEQVNKSLLEDGDLSNVNIPLLNQDEAASFIGYNINAIEFYKSIFMGDIPQPQVPSEYADEVALINGNNGEGYDFFFQNTTFSNSGYSFNSFERSFFVPTYYVGQGSYRLVKNAFSTNEFYANTGIVTFNINSNLDNSYNLVLSDSAPYMAWSGLIWALTANANGISGRTANSGSTIWSNGTILSNRSLQSILDYLVKNTRNINLYVDGVLWASAGIQSEVIPEFPDVVGGDELPTTTWPLTVPKAPSYINLPGLRQAFQRAKNTDNQFDIMDLNDSLVDPEGDPIVDPEMETVPIPLPNPDPINPEVVPELPDLPLIPPANNPGFSGVSVLAEIINFTNQSLPSSLITVFWGIVFGAVILGIIKILHK